MTRWAVALLAGCTPSAPPSSTESPPRDPPTATGGTATGPAATPTSTAPPTTAGFEGLAVTGVSCQDTNRALARFDHGILPAVPTTSLGLQSAGVIAGDFDGDGAPDLFLPGEIAQQLWLTSLGGTDGMPWSLDDGVWLAGVELAGSVGGQAVDLDDDGRIDLVITRWEQPNVLLRNTGTGFEDATPAAWSANAWRTQALAIADADGDGDLDVLFGSYGPHPVWEADPAMLPADPAELYRNDGATWTEVPLPAEAHDGYTFAAAWHDLNGDRLPELLLANDFGRVRPSLLLWNLGGLTFSVDSTWHPDVEDMGLAIADLDGDLEPDFLLTSWQRISVLASGTGVPGWVDSSLAWELYPRLGTWGQVFGWGIDAGDVDADGFLDVAVAFGNWDDWPAAVEEHDGLFLRVQDGPILFDDVADAPEWAVDDTGAGRGQLLADLDGDGWLDLVKRQVDGPTAVHLARCTEDAAWVEVALVGPPPNAAGIGATVVVDAGGRQQIRWITTGSGMYGGTLPVAHFGLGTADAIDALEVRWPDGTVQAWAAVPARSRLTAHHPTVAP